MSSNNEEKYIETHNRMLDNNGFTVKALWGSEASQLRRFEALEKLFKSKTGFSVLDYGCGLAHFYEFLLNNGYKDIKYIGVDINEKFVNEAKKKYPELQIICGSNKKVEGVLEEGVDYLISSGIYNLGESEEQVQNVFLNDYKKYFELIKVGLGVNFLSSKSENKDNVSVYHNPYPLIEACEKNITKKIAYFHDYLPHDFTILIFK